MLEWKTLQIEFPNDGLQKGLEALTAEGWEILTIVTVNYRGIIVAKRTVVVTTKTAKTKEKKS